MNEDALVQLSEELLKNGLVSIVEIMKLLNEMQDNKRCLYLRNKISGKYTSFLQQDIPHDILKEVCNKHGIKLDIDVRTDPDTYKPIIRFTVDNKKLPEIYEDLYRDAVSKNTETVKILEKYNIPYNLENVSCLYRADDSKTADVERLKYTQKIHIDEKYKDSLSEIFELQDKSTYLVFGTPENYSMSFAAEILQSKLQNTENRTDEMNDLLNHNTYDVAYDLESDCIIINADRVEIEPFIRRYTPAIQENIIYAKDRAIFEQYLLNIPNQDSAPELNHIHETEYDEMEHELEVSVVENDVFSAEENIISEDKDSFSMEEEMFSEEDNDIEQELKTPVMEEDEISTEENDFSKDKTFGTDEEALSMEEEMFSEEDNDIERELKTPVMEEDEISTEENDFSKDKTFGTDEEALSMEEEMFSEEDNDIERELKTPVMEEDEISTESGHFTKENGYSMEEPGTFFENEVGYENVNKSALESLIVDKTNTSDNLKTDTYTHKESVNADSGKGILFENTKQTEYQTFTSNTDFGMTSDFHKLVPESNSDYSFTKHETTKTENQKSDIDNVIFDSYQTCGKTTNNDSYIVSTPHTSVKHQIPNNQYDKRTVHVNDTKSIPITESGYDYADSLKESANVKTNHIYGNNRTAPTGKKYVSQTHDEIKETVRKTESSRNLYHVVGASSDALGRLMDMSKHHKQAVAGDDEYIKGQKTMKRYNDNLTALFAHGEFKRSNKADIADFNQKITDGKYKNLEQTMRKNGFKDFKDSNFDTVAEHLNHQIKKAGLDTKKFRLYTKSDLPSYVAKNRQKFEMLFHTTDKVALEQMAAQVKDIIRINDNINIQHKLQSKRKASALFQNAMNEMGDEVEGYRVLDRSIRSVQQSQKAFYQINNLRVDLAHKKYQTKIRRYQEKIATKSARVKNNVDLLNQALNPSYKQKLTQKNEAYEKYIQKLENRKQKRTKQIEKLNNYQDYKIAKNTEKNLRGLAKKEQKLKKMEAKIKLKQDKTFHGPLKAVQEKVNLYQVDRAKVRLEKDTAKVTAKKAKHTALKNKLSTVKNNIKNTKIGKTIGKVGSTASKAAKPIQLFYKLKAQLSELLLTLIKTLGKAALIVIAVIIAIYLIILLIMTCYGIFSSNMFSLTFRNSPEMTSPMETDFGKIYLELSEAEKTWVESVKTTGNGTFKFTDFDENNHIIDWNSALSSVDDSSTYSGYTYKDGKIYADPFGLGEEYAEEIEYIDGGNVATFYNVNNNASLSNLKDILCLLSVFYDDSFSDYTLEGAGLVDSIQDSLANWKTTWSKGTSNAKNKISSVLNSIFGCNIQPVSYRDYTRELASEKYALALFEASHDISVSLYNISILPTESQADENTLSAAKQGSGFVNGARVLCTKKYGCADTGLFYYDSDGGLHTNSTSGPSTTNKGQALNTLVNTRDGSDYEWDKCYTLTEEEDREDSDCWYTTTEEISYEEEETKTDPKTGKKTTTTVTKTKEETTWHHSCKGHHGSYCCGHAMIQTAGIIHGLPTDFANGTKSAHEGYETQHNAHEPIVSDTALIDEIDLTDDIIDIDTKISHSFIPSTWVGWTAEKVDWVINRYCLDWQEFYGFSPETSIPSAYTGNVIGMTGGSTGYYGNATYSSADIDEWMEKIKFSYDISPTVEQKLRLGLSYVGKAAYNQGYHGSKFVENGGKGITATDCSGFASNIWYQELGNTIYTCYYLDEWGKQNGKRHSMRNASGLEPGDIILSMNNKYGGGSSNHAMVYLGTFDGQIYCVESTSSNNGGIFAMARGNGWYTRPGSNGNEIMYYLDMTP